MEKNQHKLHNPPSGQFLDDKKQIKMIKIAIVFVAISCVSYMAADYLLYLQSHPGLELQQVSSEYNSFQIESGFGTIELFDTNQEQEIKPDVSSLVYTDENLGFEIYKPNLGWNFNTDLDVMVQKNNDKLLSNGFNGGLYVEKENDKAFFVAVFDINNPEQFLLEDYVNTQMDYLQSKFETKVIVRTISPDNDWAIFGMIVDFGDRTSYGEQLLQIHNEKLYMLQYTGLPPEKLAQQDKEERRQIIDSFYVNNI